MSNQAFSVRKSIPFVCSIIIFLLSSTGLAAAQSTAFTYQGRLVDNGNLANTSYDMQFKLFDALINGNQIGTTLTFDGTGSNPPAVAVTNGIFTIALDFGNCSPSPCFNGNPRFLEVAVRLHGNGSYTTLSPRQQITATPYAMKPANLTFNGSYDDGTGTTFSASNSFAGDSAGVNTTPDPNPTTVTGKLNAFFGAGAGKANLGGNKNAFFGYQAGQSNTNGSSNAFFGYQAGFRHVGGFDNTFIGFNADFSTANPTGGNNTLLGANTSVSSGVNLGTAIGANATVTQSNSLVLGNNVNVGIGTTAPTSRLHVVGNGLFTGNLTVNGTLTASLPAGSANYIQNQTAASQIGDFNISGNGTVGGTLAANIVNAARYDINGQKVLSVVVGADCLYVGFNAGSNGSCEGHSFVGTGTGSSNTSGFHNSYFGSFAGNANTSGANNAFFGYLAGRRNTSGASNAFFGSVAGFKNTVGQNNTFIGEEADFNVFDPTGDNNTLLGFNANVNSGVNNGTAIGANASVTQSNSLILGSINGVNSATADTKVGIGTTTPGALLDVQRDGGTIPETARFTTFGTSNLILGRSSNGTRAAPAATPIGRVLLQLGATGHDGTDFATTARASIQLIASEDWTPTALGTNIRFLTTANGTVTTSTRLFIRDDGNVGIGTTAPLDKLDVNGDIRVGTGTNGCVKDSDGTVIAGTACSSDARFKRDIVPFPHLLDKLVRLQPVHFFWRNEEFKERHFGSSKSFGLIAQEVEKVLPELVSEDVQGYKAVNYSKLPLLSLQAIKELKAENDTLKQKLSEQQGQLALQQQQLSQQQQQISQQQQEMAAVKKLLCQSQPQADLCKAKSVH